MSSNVLIESIVADNVGELKESVNSWLTVKRDSIPTFKVIDISFFSMTNSIVKTETGSVFLNEYSAIIQYTNK